MSDHHDDEGEDALAPVIPLPTAEQGFELSGDEEWLTTLEDPHDTTVIHLIEDDW